MFLKHSFVSLLIFNLTSFAQAQETPTEMPSVLCKIVGHSIYKNTIVFGSGKRELYLFEEDRDKQLLLHEGFELILTDESYKAVDENNEVLFQFSTEGKSFVRIKENIEDDAESQNFEISDCIGIAG